MKIFVAAFALDLGIILVNLTGQCHAALQVGFYEDKCKSADFEGLVFQVVRGRFMKDPTIAAALIRLHFHDCFVKGFDASILLDGISGEKTAFPNLSVRGYDVIDEAKNATEHACEGVVSCADIIAMAARDAVPLSGGRRYNVETGRRVGLESLDSNVDLPSPRFTVSQSIDAFKEKGLTPTDMVYLLGGHTVGVANCTSFQDRLYNFENTMEPDPTMDRLLLTKLRFICPQNSAGGRALVNLDQNPWSALRVDNSFYNQIRENRGILQIDQGLALDHLTKDKVAKIASDNNDFLIVEFGRAMVQMGAIDVLTDPSQGEIRKSCHVTNNNLPTSFIFG